MKNVTKSENFEESLKEFCCNLAGPMHYLSIKPNNKAVFQPAFMLLNSPEAADLIFKICSNSTDSEKHSAYKQLKEAIKESSNVVYDALVHIKTRCFNFFMSFDQIEHILDNYELLTLIGQTFPELIFPYLSRIITSLLDASDKKHILNIVSSVDIKNCKEYDIVEKIILQVFDEGSSEEIKAAGKAMKFMKFEFVEYFFCQILGKIEIFDSRTSFYI